MLWDFLKSMADWLRDTFMGIIDKIVNAISNAISKAKSLIGMGPSSSGSKTSTKGGFATGGTVQSTGSYMLQKGEYVMPNRGGGNGVSVTITGNIYGTDPQEISEAIIARLRNNITLW